MRMVPFLALSILGLLAVLALVVGGDMDGALHLLPAGTTFFALLLDWRPGERRLVRRLTRPTRIVDTVAAPMPGRAPIVLGTRAQTLFGGRLACRAPPALAT